MTEDTNVVLVPTDGYQRHHTVNKRAMGQLPFVRLNGSEGLLTCANHFAYYN